MKDNFRNIVWYASKAPSGHNTQPWKFRIDNEYPTLILRIGYAETLPYSPRKELEALFI